jgi:hypothetical protein
MESLMPIGKEYRALLAILLTATTLAGVKAYAQGAAGMWDASQLPETKGTVRQYTLTPRGDVDGLILNDGTEVKVPPHLTGQIVFSIRPGDAVTIRGLRAKVVALVDAASITNDTNGKTIIDNGPPGRNAFGAQNTISGRVVLALHGKQGEVNGALLDNGTTVRLPPPEADRLQTLLQPGQTITVRGDVLTTALGTVVDASAIGNSPDQLTEILDSPPRGPRDRARPGPPPRGPNTFAPPAPGFGPPPPR